MAFLALIVAAGPGRCRARAEAVYYVSQNGDDGNPGTAEQPWRHIEWAMTRPFLRAGDTIRISAGVYRPVAEVSPSRDSTADDTLIRPAASGEPGRPITVMAQPGQGVVLSGRFLAESWQPLPGAAPLYYHDYSTPLSFPFDHPFQVVEDGRLLYRTSTLAGVNRPGRCFVDIAMQRIYVWTSDGAPPSDHLMEYGGSATGIEFLKGARHWRLSGFSITGFKTSGVVIRGGAGGVELDHMSISYAGAHRPGADLSSGYALAVYDTSGGNYVHDCDLGHTLAEAVHISQTGAGGDLYENNKIHDAGGPEWLQEASPGGAFFGPGLILRGNRTTVRGNRFSANGYHGLILESDLRGSEGPAAPAQNIIEGNVFSRNGGNGVYADGKNGMSVSRANIIRFNLFDRDNQGRAGSSGDAELRLAGNFAGTLIYNNTFYADAANCLLLSAATLAAGAAQGADAAPADTLIANNIGVQAGRYPNLYAVRAAGIGPQIRLDYNDWFRPGGGLLMGWNGLEFRALDDFRGKIGQEQRGISADPLFVSVENGNLWLRAASPAIGRGLADVDSAFRAANGNSPDLGAFPYRPLIALSPADLRFAALTGASAPPQALEIRSPAPSPMAWVARTGESWLQVSTPAGHTPAVLVVAARTAGLGPGTHSASIQVAPALDGEPAVTVRVSLSVLASPPRRR